MVATAAPTYAEPHMTCRLLTVPHSPLPWQTSEGRHAQFGLLAQDGGAATQKGGGGVQGGGVQPGTEPPAPKQSG